MSVMARRPLVRWVVPGAVLAAVVGAGVVASTQAGASPDLPPRTAAQLLVDVYTARLDGASGTVVERADLGLPALPDAIAGAGSSTDLNSLITGSHTLRVWYSGPDKARVALLGATGESDLIRNGQDLWIWSSSGNTAQHTKLGGAAQNKTLPVDPSQLPVSPQQAADMILSALNPTTSVSLGPTTTVAGRGAYQLVVAPKDTRSLVERVTIAVDAQKRVPTQVQVFAKGSGTPAFKIGFDQVNFTRPDASRFQFTPPPGTKVNEADQDQNKAPGQGPNTLPALPSGKDQKQLPAQPSGQDKTMVVGTGWTSVLVARLPEAAAAPGGKPSTGAPASALGDLGPLLNNLPTVSGSWGSGRLLQARLFSVLITDDGRILIGPVSGQQLATVAGDPAAALK
ncbi:MAG: hypothetical protein J2P15_00775 [Micromonosporaceae bacterium]|nr:hypothetical protein [Micromonosporaceae bacterium]